jgi:putative transposase
VLGFSTQAFYKWRRQPCSQRDLEDAHLVNAIIDVHEEDPEFGYRLIADELIGRPRKVLNWETPAERLRALLGSGT